MVGDKIVDILAANKELSALELEHRHSRYFVFGEVRAIQKTPATILMQVYDGTAGIQVAFHKSMIGSESFLKAGKVPVGWRLAVNGELARFSGGDLTIVAEIS